VNNRQLAQDVYNTIGKTYDDLGNLTQASRYGNMGPAITETSQDYTQGQQGRITLYCTLSNPKHNAGRTT